MYKQKRTARALFIVFIIFTALGLASIIAYQFIPFVKDYPFFTLIAAMITCGYAGIAFGNLYKLISFDEQIRSLYIENRYNLSRESLFFNYQLFEKRINKLIKINKKPGSYVISFTASKRTVMRNLYRNGTITQLNGFISDYINELLGHNKEYDPNKFAYCYYHGQFVIYTYLPLNKVQEIILNIQKEIYAIVARNDLKVYAIPYFGVAEVKPSLSLFEILDNALTARDYSEKHFESETFYSDDLRKDASLSEVEELREAIQNNEMEVYYQPKFHLATRKFVGCEALVRWNSPRYGLLTPARFLDRAEVSGLIHEIDMFVFRRVCEDLASIRRKGDRMLPVSVNFSMYEFYSPDFFDNISKIINKTGVSTSLIQIEVTETTAQANPFMTTSILKKLKENGFRILMDDFGLGFSNLGNLNRMEFDTVKIDKSFIDGLITDSKSREIVKFLIALCKTNNMEVIAEGVDKIEQVEILKKAKCDVIQGFFYSKPLPIRDYQDFLNNNPFEKKEEAE